MKKKVLFSTHIETSVKNGHLIAARFEQAGIQLVETQLVDSGRITFDDYFFSRNEAEKRLTELFPLLMQWIGAKRFTIRVRRIIERDWSESWKKSFHTARVSRRIVIKPSWEKYKPVPGDCVVKLDPGMSFGTGLHPTTRACLCFIDKLAEKGMAGKSFLDAGCGSGVLAIAAAKLGFARVVAVDNDPLAVKAAQENCRINGVSEIVSCLHADLSTVRLKETFSIVAANMFESEHERFMKTISNAVSDKQQGYLLIAGILKKQYSGVLRMYMKQGFVEIKSSQQKEWKNGMLRKLPGLGCRLYSVQ